MRKRFRAGLLDTLVIFLLATLSLAIYTLTAAPSVATIFDDSLELQVVTYTLGIAHPTGYPLYTLLGRAFTLLPWGDPAFCVNLMSAVFGAVTVGLVYGLCRQLWCHRFAAAVGAVALALSPVFWSQATIAEVYTLHAAFLAGVLWLALWTGAAQGSLPVAWRRARLLALVYGFSLAHHRMAFLLMPPLLGYWWWLFGRRLQPRQWGRLALLMLAPLFLYAYLPIRGSVTSSLDGSYVNSPGGFLRYVTAAGYNVFLSGNPLAVRSHGLVASLGLFRQQFGILGLVLALVGTIFLWGRQGQRLLLGSALLLNLSFALAYKVADIEVFFIPSFVLVAVLLALGLDFVLKVFLGVARRAGVGWAVATYALVLFSLIAMLVPVPMRWLELDRSQDWAVHDLGRAWLQAPAPNGAVVGILGETTLLRYFQVAEGLRPDVQLFPADDEQVRLETVRWLVGKGRSTYLTRSLPGAPEEFALNAAGLLVRASQPAPDVVSDGYGEVLISGLNLLSQQWTTGEEHGRAYVGVQVSWLVAETPARSLKVSARVTRAGQVVASLDGEPVHNTYPTTYWRLVGGAPIKVVEDYYRIDLPVGDAGGSVDVVLVLYDAASGSEVARVSLGSGVVPPSRGQRPLREWGLRPQFAWLGGYRLLGLSLEPHLQARAGDSLPIHLLWCNDAAPAEGELQVSLLLTQGPQVALEQRLSLPYQEWQRGQFLRQVAQFPLPARLEDGLYQLYLTAPQIGGLPLRQLGWPPLTSRIELAEIQVTGRERTLETPQPRYPLDVSFSSGDEQVARLLGYDWQRQGDALAVSLYWQALSQPEQRFKVFVHCLDRTGNIIAQSDAEPAAGSAPTNSWISGEYILDVHTLTLPSGTSGPLRLFVGMYEGDRRLQPAISGQPSGNAAVPLVELP